MESRVWAIMEVMAEGALFAMFSMLFGAGIILLTSRAEERGGAADIADIYYRRNLWLILFGIVHAYVFLMPGDILYPYGLSALFLFPFRKLKPRTLILIGLALFLIRVPFQISSVDAVKTLQAEAASVQMALDAGENLSDGQQQTLDRWQEKSQKTTSEEIQAEINTRRSGYAEIFSYFMPVNSRSQTKHFYHTKFREVAMLMLLGMALMKQGVFSATRSFRFYLFLVVMGYGFGIPLRAYLTQNMISNNFDLLSMTLGSETYDLGRIPIALGHVGVLMLVCKSGAVRWLQNLLAAVGKTALSNYLMQTIMCIFIFNGHGLGLLAKLQRYELYYVVAGIWAFQLTTSPIWLKHFRFGPAEWLWRSLTYWDRQPMRKKLRQGSHAAS